MTDDATPALDAFVAAAARGDVDGAEAEARIGGVERHLVDVHDPETRPEIREIGWLAQRLQVRPLAHVAVGALSPAGRRVAVHLRQRHVGNAVDNVLDVLAQLVEQCVGPNRAKWVDRHKLNRVRADGQPHVGQNGDGRVPHVGPELVEREDNACLRDQAAEPVKGREGVGASEQQPVSP